MGLRLSMAWRTDGFSAMATVLAFINYKGVWRKPRPLITSGAGLRGREKNACC